MDPIHGNTDRLILLLRQRLAERSRKTVAAPGTAKTQSQTRSRGGMEAVQALAAVDGLDDGDLKRALVQNLLADQLGEGLMNEAKFQQVVTRVTDTIEANEAGAKLLARLARELRASAKP